MRIVHWTVVAAVLVWHGAGGVAVAQEAEAAALRAWNSDVLTLDDRGDFKGAADPVGAVTIAAARGGMFSGKVVVGAAAPIEQLKVTASDLSAGKAVIPASAVRLRYAVPWDGGMADGRYTPPGFDVLLESPPEAVPAEKGVAMVPVWMTVTAPRDAAPGDYRGRLTIAAKGQAALTVPVEMTVADYLLPETQQWRTWVELIQSPDTLAVEYGLEPWSEKHFDLIARSMRHIGASGSRILYVPLICYTNLGNTESMVRWIQKTEDRFDYDFTPMDKYLDTAIEQMGKPKLVVFNVWEIYQDPADKTWNDEWFNKLSEKQREGGYFVNLKKRGDLWRELQAKHGLGPAVSMLDTETKKVNTIYLPPYAAEESRKLWQPLMDEIRRRMEKRGIAGAMMLGMSSDAQPSKEEAAFWHEVSGGLPWVSHSHAAYDTKLRNSGAPVGYSTNVWHVRFNSEPDKGRSYGWKKPQLVAEFHRFHWFNAWPLTPIRHAAEFNITGEQRGVGKIGGDLWWAVKDKKGRRRGTVTGLCPQSHWRSLDISSCLLAPGPDGPVATARFEAFRDGVQECEARIAIEDALTDDALRAKLGDDLADRCQKMLDERVRCMWKGSGGIIGEADGKSWRYKMHPAANEWFVQSGWQKRTLELYGLAGQVAKALGKDGN